MPMSKKIFLIATVMMVIAILGGLFYWFKQHNSEIVGSDAVILDQPIIRWQEIVVTESKPKMAIHINSPRIIIGSSYGLYSEINKAITQHVESLKDDFISAATMAAEDNGETNILNIETEVLLATPRLISLAFTSTEDFSGIVNDDSKRTFIGFDLINNKVMLEGNEIFRDDLAWSRAVTIMKKTLLSDYKGDPSCDLSFAPRHNGLAASCIGVDWNRGGKHLSITGDISMSMIQEFLAPSVLSDIIQ